MDWLFFLLELLSDGGDLFDTILMCGQVAFKRLVLLLQRFQFRQTARTEILHWQKESQKETINNQTKDKSIHKQMDELAKNKSIDK